MKIIVPMAGRGSRLRPHTLTIPKPLLPVAGIPIVHRLVTDIARVLNEKIEEIAFVLGDPAFFGENVTKELQELALGLGSKATIYRQPNPLGTGHAIMCAKPSLSGPAVVAYADTLIRADFELNKEADAVIWVKKVPQPEAYGVVQCSADGYITNLVEKPKEFISDLAVIGIYYFKDIAVLKNELQYVLDHDIIKGGEYQINDGIMRMIAKGKVFATGEVSEWMDCGNKKVTMDTNAKMLHFLEEDGETLIDKSVENINSTIIPPCYLGKKVILNNATIGPHVSIGEGSVIENSTIQNSLIQKHSLIKNAKLKEAMIGNYVKYDGDFSAVSIGDFSELL